MKTGAIHAWGTEADERFLSFPCDTVLDRFDEAYYRGITIEAEPATLFKWLCQMRVAPYSYDWLDNFGRRSPQKLTPGLERLEVGQRVMTLFELTDFATNEHLTICTPGASRRSVSRPSFVSKVMGEGAISYVIVPVASGICRLLVKLVVRYPAGPVGWLMRLTLPGADLIMMRRQLLNFKRLAQGEGE